MLPGLTQAHKLNWGVRIETDKQEGGGEDVHAPKDADPWHPIIGGGRGEASPVGYLRPGAYNNGLHF